MTFSREDTKAIKAIAIILMLYHHLFAFPDRIPEGTECISICSILDNTSAYFIGNFGKICVALFLFLGGLGTYLSCKDKDNLSYTIIRKVSGLYKAYWKVFIIFIPICLFIGVERVTPNLYSFIENFLGINITYNGEWWFFTPYLLLIIIFPLIFRLMRRGKSFLTDVFIISFLHAVITYLLPNVLEQEWASEFANSLFGFHTINMLSLLPIFAVGCVFAKYDILSKIKTKTSSNPVYLIVAIAILFSVVYLRYMTGGVYDFLYAPALIISIMILLNTRLTSFLRKGLAYIGKQSTNMWLIHSFWCYSIIPKIVYAPRYTPLIFLWLFVLSYVSSILIDLFYKAIKFIYTKLKFKLQTKKA